MSSIDQRVVEMKFDSDQFQKGVNSTLGSLDSLKKGLNLDGAKASLNGLNEAGKGFSLAGIAAGVDNVASKFGILGAIGFSVIQNLTNTAMNFGSKMLGSVLDPLIQGGKERALTIEQAKFQFAGLGMDVEATMASAKKAVLGTAYGLGDAAKAASMLGASGMRAGDQMTGSLRAIAGVAAMTGSSYSDVSDIFTSVAGNGRLMGGDLLRLSQRGVNAAATLSKAMGKPEPEIRKMVTKGKISFKQFSDAMDGAFGAHAQDANKTFTGALANMKSALSRLGAEVATPEFEDQRKIFNALTPVIDNVHAALMPLITAFSEMSAIKTDKLVEAIGKIDLTALTNSIPFVINSIKNVFSALAAILKPIKEAFQSIFPPATTASIVGFAAAIERFTSKLIIGGKTSENLKRTFAGVFALFDIGITIIKQVVQMFSNLFSSSDKSSGGILSFTGGIGDFLVAVDKSLKAGKGLAGVFDKIQKALSGPIHFLQDFSAFLSSAFDSVKDVDTTGVENIGKRLHASFEPLTMLGNMVSSVWKKLGAVLKAVWDYFKPMGEAMAAGFEKLGSRISDSLKNMNVTDVLGVLNTGLFAGGILIMRSFLDRISGLFTGQSKFTVVSSLKATFMTLTNSLTVMQNSLKAKTLLEIAGAIALLALSVVALSMVDPNKLAYALEALTVMFIQLIGSMAGFTKIASSGDLLKMQLMATAMITVGIAINILVIAVKSLSKMSWEELAKGLGAVTILLGVLAATAKIMSGNSAGLVTASTSMILMAIAIRILSGAVIALSVLSWEGIGKGLAAIAGLLVLLVGAMNLMPKDLPVVAASMIGIAIAMKILAGVLGTMGNMTWEQIGKGLAVLAGSLLILSGTMNLMTSGLVGAAAMVVIVLALKMLVPVLTAFGAMSWEQIGKAGTVLAGALLLIAGGLYLMTAALPGAAALIIAAASLGVIAPVLILWGNMSWEAIGKAMVMLVGSLLLIAGGLYLMTAALPGAAAMLVVAAALWILAPVLTTFGNMSWEEIGKGLTMLAGVFLVLGVAGLLLAPVVPTILLLGVAIALIGVAMLMAGVGILAMSVGLAAIAISGVAATAGLVAMVAGLIGLIPMAFKAIGDGVILFAGVIAASGPAIIDALTVILMSLITSINTCAPAIIATLTRLLDLLLKSIADHVPSMVDSGMRIIEGFLSGFGAHISKIVILAVNLIVNFINAISANLGRIITAGANLIISFLNGIGANVGRIADAGLNLIITFVNSLANSIRSHQDAMDTAGRNLAGAIIGGMTSGLRNGVNAVVEGAKALVSHIPKAIRDFLHIGSPSKVTTEIGELTAQGVANGLINLIGVVKQAATNVGETALNALKTSISGLSNVVSDEIDIQPTIRPVLDLTDIQNKAGLIGSLLTPPKLSLDNTYSAAAAANAAYLANQTATVEAVSADSVVAKPANTITFTQNNNSPKALSNIEIYRQTRNQISAATGALVS